MYRVKYDDRELENNERSANLMLDVNLSDPFERMRQNIFGHYTEYLKDNTSFKIKSSNNSTRNHGDRFLILPAINEDLYPLII